MLLKGISAYKRIKYNNINNSILLIFILLGGFLIRWVFWNIHTFKGDISSTFESMARFIVQGNFVQYLNSQRPHQPIYPILLTPYYLFNLELSTYTFWLHQLLALATIYIVYQTANRLFGNICSLISAALISFNPMIAFWFSWISGDIPFHFFLALFSSALIYRLEIENWKSLLFFFVSGILCFLTRPEGLFVFIMGICLLAYQFLRRKLSLIISFIFIVGVSIFIFLLGLSSLYFDVNLRQKFFSNIHVAYPLFISSRLATNSPSEQQKVYSSMGEVTDAAKNNHNFISANYALSMAGLRFIKDHPLKWIKMYCLRFISIITPSIFSPWWSLPHRIYDFFTFLFFVIGSLTASFWGGPARFQSLSLTLMGFTIAFAISLFQREMDHRVPISMFVLFSTVSPYGWLMAYRKLFFQRNYG